jgi:hypothetical protein
MTDPNPDSLEAELTSMKPVDLSPALSQRIGEALAQSAQPHPRAFWLRRAALPVAAACIALIAWLAVPHYSKHPSSNYIFFDPIEPVAPATHVATLADYRRALAESPARLDALFDAQAELRFGSADPSPPDVRAAGACNWIP